MKSKNIVILIGSILTLFFSLSLTAKPSVQIETGIVVDEIVDLELSDGDSLFELNRIYVHGGKNKSLLGSSWCFDFEEELRTENEGLRLVACGKPTSIFFKRLNDEFVFENEKIVKTKKGQFKRTTATEIIKYDEMGQMISRAARNKNSSTIKYLYDENNKINKIEYANHYDIEFNFDKNGKLSSISTKGRRVAAYSVIEESLVSVKNAFGDTYGYDYNDMGYVTHVNLPDQSGEQFSYDNKTKLVARNVAVDGCVRDYEYSLKSQNRLDLKLIDSCQKERPLTVSFSDEIKHKLEKKKSKKGKRKLAENESEIVVKRDDQKRINKIEDQIKTWIIEYKDEKNKIVTITEVTKKTNKSKVYKAKYKNGQITELLEKGKSKVKFVYSKSGEFLKAKGDKKNKTTIAKFELIHAVVSSN